MKIRKRESKTQTAEEKMNLKKCSIRPIGQRSIASTFLFRAANRSSDCTRDVQIKGSREKGSHISFSDFLNRKLHRSSVLPTALERKEPSLSSPLRDDQLDRSVKGETSKNEGRNEAKLLIDGAFDLFKNVKKGKHEIENCYSISEPEIIDVDDLPQTRKRKFLFEDHDDNPTARKRVVVLGEDSKPVQSSRKKKYSSEEPRPVFNHYKSGVGWWNENMEGVDNEEVGCNDVWEGVGCTTLGGLEWH